MASQQLACDHAMLLPLLTLCPLLPCTCLTRPHIPRIILLLQHPLQSLGNALEQPQQQQAATPQHPSLGSRQAPQPSPLLQALM